MSADNLEKLRKAIEYGGELSAWREEIAALLAAFEEVRRENERLNEDVIREKAYAQSSEYNLVQEIEYRKKLQQANARKKARHG